MFKLGSKVCAVPGSLKSVGRYTCLLFDLAKKFEVLRLLTFRTPDISQAHADQSTDLKVVGRMLKNKFGVRPSPSLLSSATLFKCLVLREAGPILSCGLRYRHCSSC
jgi:hypothetical protein